jgi:hypothetical protein
MKCAVAGLGAGLARSGASRAVTEPERRLPTRLSGRVLRFGGGFASDWRSVAGPVARRSNYSDQIDLTRGSPKRHLAFGHGIHFCVGAALARIEARAVLQAVLEQTRDFALDPDHHPQWVDSLLVRRHQQLHVCATPL